MPNYFSKKSANTILEKITDVFSGFFDDDSGVVGIDIGSSAIKVVQIKRKDGKIVLETYGELSLGSYAKQPIGQATKLPKEKIGEALLDIMREARITSKNTGITIPLSSSLITVMDMPFLSEKKLKEMVPLEARKYIPVPISEVTLDWRVLPESEETDEVEQPTDDGTKKDKSEVPAKETSEGKKTVKLLVAAIHNEVLSKYQWISDFAKLKTSFFEIEVFSLLRSLIYRERAPVFVIDIGAATSKLLIVEDHVVMSSHIINRGSQDITLNLAKSLGVNAIKAEEIKRLVGLSNDPEEVKTRDVVSLVVSSIFDEVNRVIFDYEKKNHKPVSKIILTGGGSLLKGILEDAQKKFDIEVSLADPFARVETPAFLDPVLKEAGPNFAGAIGVAIRRLEESR